MKEMKKQTLKNSEEAAKPIIEIMKHVLELDIEYLSQALKDMKKHTSMRESMAVMNPNPMTHNENQSVDRAKQRQLELMLELAKNAQNIMDSERKLIKARTQSNELGQLFGF